MSQGSLADIIVRFIEFLELTDDEQLDPRLAVKFGESIAADLADATEEERSAVMKAARSKLEWLVREPDEFGYSPRKTVSPKRRALLEGIATGQVFGWSSGAP